MPRDADAATAAAATAMIPPSLVKVYLPACVIEASIGVGSCSGALACFVAGAARNRRTRVDFPLSLLYLHTRTHTLHTHARARGTDVGSLDTPQRRQPHEPKNQTTRLVNVNV